MRVVQTFDIIPSHKVFICRCVYLKVESGNGSYWLMEFISHGSKPLINLVQVPVPFRPIPDGYLWITTNNNSCPSKLKEGGLIFGRESTFFRFIESTGEHFGCSKGLFTERFGINFRQPVIVA